MQRPIDEEAVCYAKEAVCVDTKRSLLTLVAGKVSIIVIRFHRPQRSATCNRDEIDANH